MDFFGELYSGANQPRTIGMIERLRAEAGRYWLERRVEYVRQPGQRDHMEVLDFIKKGDTEGAVHWLEQHLETVCDELVALMEEADQSAE